MRTRLFVMVAGVGLLLAAAPVWAHHAFSAEFDINRPLKLQGTITKWQVTNPHSWIHMDVKGPDGNLVSWAIEGGSPNTLYRLGFTKESLVPGTEIVVDGFQAKDNCRTRRSAGTSRFPTGRSCSSAGRPLELAGTARRKHRRSEWFTRGAHLARGSAEGAEAAGPPDTAGVEGLHRGDLFAVSGRWLTLVVVFPP